MAKKSNIQQEPHEKPRYFYVYITGHGIPSHFILHVGYSSSNYNSYPTWFSEGVSLETAEKIHEKVKLYDHSDTYSAETVKKEINKYIKMAKEGKL